MGKAILKELSSSEEAITLIIDSAIIRHTVENSILDMHNLNEFHCLINYSNINKVDYPDFAMYWRKNLANEKFSSSSIHILNLDMKNHHFA